MAEGAPSSIFEADAVHVGGESPNKEDVPMTGSAESAAESAAAAAKGDASPPETSPDPPPQQDPLAGAEAMKQDGNRRYAAGDYDEAVRLYSGAIALAPDNAAYRCNRAAAKVMLEQIPAALEDCLQAIELDPSFRKAYSRGARCCKLLGQFTRAKELLARIVDDADISNVRTRHDTLKSTRGDSGSNVAAELHAIQALELVMENAQKRLDENLPRDAASLARRALAQVPRALHVNLLLLEALSRSKRWEEARRVSDAIYHHHPQDHRLLYWRGLAQYHTQNTNMALRHFQQILRSDPDNRNAMSMYKKVKKLEATKAKGNEAYAAGRIQEALSAYTEALTVDPENVVYNAALHSNRAAALIKLGRHAEAVQDCTLAIRGKPGYVKAYVRRAQCHTELEQYQDAVYDLEKARELDAENGDVRAKLRAAQLELKKSKRKDYYKILGVSKRATSGEIKKAYRKLALKHHPDKNNETEEKRVQAEKMFKDITEAYGTLSDADLKRRYDSGADLEGMGGGGGGGGGGGFDADQIFRAFFQGGGMGGGGGQHHFHFG